MTKAQLVKAALKARRKEQTNDANGEGNLSTPAVNKNSGVVKETANGNPLKTVPNTGLPAPKKPSNAAPDAGKGRGVFFPNLVKKPKGKGGKAVIPPKKPVGAVFWPKAKTR